MNLDERRGAFAGYRPWYLGAEWNDGHYDSRFWTCWERSYDGIDLWPSVVDDHGALRSSRATCLLAQRAGSEE